LTIDLTQGKEVKDSNKLRGTECEFGSHVARKITTTSGDECTNEVLRRRYVELHTSIITQERMSVCGNLKQKQSMELQEKAWTNLEAETRQARRFFLKYDPTLALCR
jgi:hypothetical protein